MRVWRAVVDGHSQAFVVGNGVSVQYCGRRMDKRRTLESDGHIGGREKMCGGRRRHVIIISTVKFQVISHKCRSLVLNYYRKSTRNRTFNYVLVASACEPPSRCDAKSTHPQREALPNHINAGQRETRGAPSSPIIATKNKQISKTLPIDATMIRFSTLIKGLFLCMVHFAPVSAFAPSRHTHVIRPWSKGQPRNAEFHHKNFTGPSKLPHGLSMMLNVPRGGEALASKLTELTKTPSGLFNTALVALALTTASIKVWQRSTSDKSKTTSAKPQSVKSLQIRFLCVFWLLRCADWLQGPYFYEVYASKVFNGAQASLGLVSKLFLTGFASTALFGPLVGRASDQFGRKRGTLAFCLLYALGAASTKSPLLGVLLMGRLFSGIGTSLLFSAPESWLVGESQQSNDDPDGTYLGETFGLVRNYAGQSKDT